MTTSLETRFTIDSWDEEPYRELDGGEKLTRAVVALTGEDGLGAATFAGLMHYTAEGSSAYVVLLHVAGALDGREGTFVLRGTGGYQDETASWQADVVAGAGTGELAGLTGSASSSSTAADYPHMPVTLTYDLG